jgi:hypothetical protein
LARRQDIEAEVEAEVEAEIQAEAARDNQMLVEDQLEGAVMAGVGGGLIG